MFNLFPRKKIRTKLLPGVRVIAIGDIHGQKNRFSDLIRLLERYRQKNPMPEEHMVFLGDFVDRGPKSVSIIEELMARKKSAQNTAHTEIFLMGNHESLLLENAQERSNREDLWWRNGGQQTVLNYLTHTDCVIPKNASQADIFDLFRVHFPKKHLKFLSDLDHSYQVGPLVFAHAGIQMDSPLDQQSEKDLHWIRDPFLNWSGAEKDFLVVHGHSITPSLKPEIHPHRIGIDTGSYKERGRITAAIFEGNKVQFLSSGTRQGYNKNIFS
jgi:Calcineurin-like phosphoesterase